MNFEVYTIGHSNHEMAAFIGLLRRHAITALGDVRSYPYSRYVPQYSRELLKATLASSDIAYVFLGKELGARSNNPACYRQGKVQYNRLAKEPLFAEGVKRIMQGIERYRIALMCAEKDPIECHRALLVARKLSEIGIPINHIHADGSVETHQAIESRLLAICNLPEGDMFKSREEFLAEAYTIQGKRVAYQDKNMEQGERNAER
ncbi:DUF488 family protein [Nitrosococcus wardiae]|uniref:DUF488 domain-containing protein n=1 Tax=Nitrosococcus wardiae TaxID=1814290 RepID=A0A4P7BW94_9GAMM|nr:DUF488 domain-containing protein [Nitrosococcus wardiae]QBQ53354.1 DUF488 domain-containing protein [Nitrosococcus wardiae]